MRPPESIREGVPGSVATLVLAILSAGIMLVAGHEAMASQADRWTGEEKATMASMQLSRLPVAPADPAQVRVTCRSPAVAWRFCGAGGGGGANGVALTSLE